MHAFRKRGLRWLKTVSSTFQDLGFHVIIIATLYQLMLQSRCQKTVQSLVKFKLKET